jgi:hypothetical protein
MKTKNKLISILVLSMILMIASCKKSYLDINTDPNNATDVPPRVLLPAATVSMAFANGNELGKAAALLLQYTASTGPSVAGGYDTWVFSDFFSQWYYELYGQSLGNLSIIIQKTQASSPAYSGIARLEYAYTVSMITDLFGDVPYSQATQGIDSSTGFPKFEKPRFDAQMDIYLGNSSLGITSLFNVVRQGLDEISRPSLLKPGADDVVYGGNLSKWTKFGNSLLMKFALQVSNKAPDTTRAVINSIITANKPYIGSDATDINGASDFNVPFTANNPNPYYLQDIGGSIPNTQMLSNRFLALERSLNDSLRLSKFYTKPAATFVGNDNGTPFAAPALNLRSIYGTYVLGPTRSGEAPIRLLTAFRNYFILAEASLLYGVSGDPNTYYQNAIKASFLSTGLTLADYNAYAAANPTVVTLSGTNADKLKQIITQKYIASVGNAIESYNDYRRTGYPVLTPPLQTFGDDPLTLPTRFPYTTAEAASNPNQPNPRPKTNVKVWWAL